MRFLHVSDLHIGKTLNGFALADDQRHMLDRLIETAVEAKAEAIVLAGDLYDKTTPSAEATALIDRFFTKAVDRGLKVIAVPGNHDSAERIAYVGRLLKKQGVHVAPLFEGTIEPVVLKDEHGAVCFWPIPFLKPVNVRKAYPEKAEDIGSDYTEAMRQVVDRLGIDPRARNVAVAHQFVTSAAHKPERCDSELNVGGLDNVDASVFDAFDYTALGHLHRPQRIGRDTVRYAGSPLKYSVSEANHAKSAVLVTLREKAPDEKPGDCVSLELIPIEPLHDLRAVTGPIKSIVSPEAVAAGDPDDYLHVTLTDEAPPLDALARLRAVFPNVIGIATANSLERRTSSTAAAEAALTEATDPFEMFVHFFTEQNGSEPTPDQRALLSEILEDANDREGERA